VRCALFKPKSQWLNFVPREGLRVLARGRLTLYEARGDYQLILDSLEEAGEGALRRAFEELKAKLTAEGLFEHRAQAPLPASCAASACSPRRSGAAVRDVLSVLARRFPLVQVDVLPVQVQGEARAGADPRCCSAHRRGRYDTMLLARGGGSLEDLWAFNDERLVRAIAQSPCPSSPRSATRPTSASAISSPTCARRRRRSRPSCWCPSADDLRAPAGLHARGATCSASPARDDAARRSRGAAPARVAPAARLDLLCRRQAEAQRRLAAACASNSNAGARDCATPTRCCARCAAAPHSRAAPAAGRVAPRPRPRMARRLRARCDCACAAWRVRCKR
jgi:exodeoxyribonuclease VII large subunit